MPIDISIPVQLQRDRQAKEADEANIRLQELQRLYRESPEQRIARDRADLQRLQNDPHHVNKIIGGSNAAQNEEATLAARIRTAESAVEAARLDVDMGHNPAVGETTIGDQIPRRDHAGAIASLVEAGVGPNTVETFLRSGHGDAPDGPAAEQKAAKEWEQKLFSDPEMREKFLKKDPEVMRQFAVYGIFRADPRREP